MEKTELFTDGEAYERMMGRWSRLVGETFLAWLDLPKGLRWLDVGCGNGAFTEEIIARCDPATVVAIDPSDEQLAFARTRPGTKMAKFEVGDAGLSRYDSPILSLEGLDEWRLADIDLCAAHVRFDPKRTLRLLRNRTRLCDVSDSPPGRKVLGFRH